jgi:succinoglycan biosynthesis protein ExoV
MRLHYYKDPQGNFGDDLNAWLWPKLIPRLLDDNENESFVGIGTLLNDTLPTTPILHIFGSGVGYGKGLPIVDERFVIHALRGPLSAGALKVSDELAVTDAAILIRLFMPRRPEPRARCGLIVHNSSLEQFDWSIACELAGIRFISCQWEVERVLQALGECEIVLCEAMHGAIVSDALRIPWIPLSLYGAVLNFKWEDWLASLDMRYAPRRITSLHSDYLLSPMDQRKARLKRFLRRCGIWRENWTPPHPSFTTGKRELHQAAEELRRLAAESGCLSDDKIINLHMERYQELLSRLPRRLKYPPA